MKNTFLKTIGTALAILMLAIFAQVRVSAQDVVNEEKNGEQKRNESFQMRGELGARDLEGTWDVQLTIRNCQTNVAIRTIQELTTFMSGGTMLASTSGVLPALKTPGHGVWSHTGGREYKFSFKFFNFDASGNLTGWTIIRQFALVNSSATGYETFGGSEIYAPNGNLIFTGCSTTRATRFE
jgi:hypothetical protein